MTAFSQFFEAGRQLHQASKYAEAESALRSALALCPDRADAWYLLGLACAAQGRHADASACYRDALRLQPEIAATHNSLGIALIRQNDPQQAAVHFEQAVKLRPDFATAHSNLGNVLKQFGRDEEALGHLQEALRLQPDYAEAHSNLGNVLRGLGRLEEAATRYREAVRLRPGFADAWHNLGVVLKDLGREEEALPCFRQAVKMHSTVADTHNHLGALLQQRGHFGEALACYETALRQRPDFWEAHLNRALVWLLQGDFARGLPEYEWRSRGLHRNPRPFAQPWWDGSSLKGRTILLCAEQGLGDTLQFVRYAPLLKQRGATVLLLCPPNLCRIFAGFSGIDRLLGEGEPLPAFDVHAPLLSLPRLMGTTAGAIPAALPYLSADAELVQHWRDKLGTHRGLTVGIAWQGNPSFWDDRNRSIPLAQFAPLARVPGVRLVSLQKGLGSEQVRTVGFPVLDFTAQMDEHAGAFMDTAAVMRNLDLIISSDTVIPHLAGALGVPTWMALSFVPEWRWQLVRQDSPWYPSLRLFRQARPGRWDDVFQCLAEELSLRVGLEASP